MSILIDKSRVEYISLEKDVVVDYQDYSHVRILKLFESFSPDKSLTSQKLLELRPDHKENKLFHLRFYLPREVILDKRKKIDRCIIMINGLDEVKYFTLYDQLGQNFAKSGIASVLLPTPHHLNRHHLAKDPKLPHEHLFNEPLLIFYNTKQSIKDVNDLVDKIRGKEETKGLDDKGFYKHYFDGNKVQISLLGYSLGGLRALSCLFSQPKRFSCCFLLNSGFRLSDLKLERIGISQQKWEDFLKNLEKELCSTKNRKIQTDSYYTKIFAPIFLGIFQRGIEEELRLLAKRILLIVGGSDEIVSPLCSRIDHLFTTELTIFQIPGVTHILSLDKVWINWVNLTTDLMINFEENVSRDLWLTDEIIKEIQIIDNKYNLFKEDEKFDESKFSTYLGRIADEKSREEFISLYYNSKAYYSDFNRLIQQVKRKS